MSAVEEIQAAIDKLTRERDECGYFEMNGWLAEDVPGAEGTIDDPGYAPITNDELMVTLHRTIDAQLAILRNFTEVYGVDKTPGGYQQAFLTLARAINGLV